MVLTDADSENLFTATVDLWEPLGTKYTVYLTAEGTDLIAVTGNIEGIERNEEVGISDIEKLYVFDPDTGDKLLSVDRPSPLVEQ